MLLTRKFSLLKLAQFTLIVSCSFFIATADAARLSVRKSLIKASNIDESGKYTFASCSNYQHKVFDTDSRKKKAIIIGDSQACDFLNGVLENNYLKDYQIQFRYIPYQCQPVLSKDVSRFIEPKDRSLCANHDKVDSLEKARRQIKQADLIIFAARWKHEAAKALPQTIKNLGLNPQQKVVVIGSKNFGKVTIRQYLRMSDSELRRLRNEVGDSPREINTILRENLDKKTIFVDQYKLVCGTGITCPVFTDNLKLISYDGRHLTKVGARYVGRILFRHSSLGKM
jgi:hypothetical protein